MDYTPSNKIVRIGVFYDGNCFHHISSYYAYHHKLKKRICINGLHGLIKGLVSYYEANLDVSRCKIAEAHYFKGRYNAYEASRHNILFKERVFEEVLQRENITPHYRPLSEDRTEKGIDVWLALEAYERTMIKKFDVVVLIATDSDFVPLIFKLDSLGVKTLLIGCNFEYYKHDAIKKQTLTCPQLLKIVDYPFLLNELVDGNYPSRNTDKKKFFNDLMGELFITRQEEELKPLEPKLFGKISNLQDTYGFIECKQFSTNLFFHKKGLKNIEFEKLMVGDTVEFILGENYDGICAISVEKLEYI